jgi:hypothetical protein
MGENLLDERHKPLSLNYPKNVFDKSTEFAIMAFGAAG